MKNLMRDVLKFKTSDKELEQMLKDEYNEIPQDFYANIDDEKINFNIFITMIDRLKREKLVLVKLLNSLNYFIVILLMVLVMLYISMFYTYRF
jgi:hypothetical protein